MSKLARRTLQMLLRTLVAQKHEHHHATSIRSWPCSVPGTCTWWLQTCSPSCAFGLKRTAFWEIQKIALRAILNSCAGTKACCLAAPWLLCTPVHTSFASIHVSVAPANWSPSSSHFSGTTHLPWACRCQGKCRQKAHSRLVPLGITEGGRQIRWPRHRSSWWQETHVGTTGFASHSGSDHSSTGSLICKDVTHFKIPQAYWISNHPKKPLWSWWLCALVLRCCFALGDSYHCHSFFTFLY